MQKPKYSIDEVLTHPTIIENRYEENQGEFFHFVNCDQQLYDPLYLPNIKKPSMLVVKCSNEIGVFGTIVMEVMSVDFPVFLKYHLVSNQNFNERNFFLVVPYFWCIHRNFYQIY